VVQAVVEAKGRIATAHLSAIDNFQTTVASASPTEAQPDFLGVVFKSGLKVAEKASVVPLMATSVRVCQEVDATR
jgi:hypothetical protein